MKPISPQLQAILGSRQFFVADLYTFVLVGGGALRYCGGDRNITANGLFYPAGGQIGPYFDRQDSKAKVRWKVGVEVDTLVFDVIPGSATVLGEPFLQAVRTGLFDGADCTLERVFMPSYGDTRAGTVVMFAGRVAEVDAGRSIATFTVNSHLELLNLELPRNLYQAPCVNNLADAACGVNLAAFAVAGSIVAAGPTFFVTAGFGGRISGYFVQGKIQMTSGANSGLTRLISGYDPATGNISVIDPFPTVPNGGDTFTAFPGCDHSLGPNGCPKFNNVPRFKGFPAVPAPETAI